MSKMRQHEHNENTLWDNQRKRKDLANELENLNETQSALNADYRKLKAQAARDQFEGRKPKQRKGRSKQKKRVFDPRHVNDFGGGDETPVELTTSTKKESLGPAMAMEVPAAATSDKPLPPQWEELYDEAEGKPYFYNNKTDESSWDRPE